MAFLQLFYDKVLSHMTGVGWGKELERVCPNVAGQSSGYGQAPKGVPCHAVGPAFQPQVLPGTQKAWSPGSGLWEMNPRSGFQTREVLETSCLIREKQMPHSPAEGVT